MVSVEEIVRDNFVVAAANRAATAGPAWPVPIMIASKCFLVVVKPGPRCGFWRSGGEHEVGTGVMVGHRVPLLCLLYFERALIDEAQSRHPHPAPSVNRM
jgi:hypothetical protein